MTEPAPTSGRAVRSRPRTPGRRLRAAILRIGVLILALVVIARVTGCMESLFYVPTTGPTPPPADLPGAEGVAFASADGTGLYGWFIPAPESAREDGGAPTRLLHVHGNAGNIDSHLWFTEYLPGHGFNLFLFDYRGYGQSDGRARRRTDLVADASAALDVLLARDDVDPARIGLYGQSLGGSIGLLVMAGREEIRAAVIESAFTSWRDIAADALGRGDPGPVARTIAGVLIRDHDRPVDAVGGIDRPLLFLHGNRDSIIPFKHGQALAAAAPRGELVELDGGDHNTLRTTHPEIEEITVDFFRRFLVPPGPEAR